jgi:hypothetical protein
MSVVMVPTSTARITTSPTDTPMTFPDAEQARRTELASESS